jgi:hypothetical protein
MSIFTRENNVKNVLIRFSFEEEWKGKNPKGFSEKLVTIANTYCNDK